MIKLLPLLFLLSVTTVHADIYIGGMPVKGTIENHYAEHKADHAQQNKRVTDLNRKVESNWQYQNQRDAAQDKHFTGKINNLQFQVDDLYGEVDKAMKGVVISMAMAAAPQSVDVNTTSVSFGAASYEGETGGAVSLSHRFERVTLNLSAGSAGSDSTAVAAGVGYNF